MKYIYKLFLLFVFVFGVTSCDENESFEILQAPDSFQILTPSSGSVIALDDTNLSNNALFISWKSTTSGSDASYTIEVAETGTDFGNPITLGTVQGNNFSMTVDELNTFLLDVMELNPEVANSIDIRVSTNGEVSQTIAVIVMPYTVEYTELYLVGSLTNWTPEEALPMTRLDFNIFEITIDLADGDEFKFLPTNTSFDGDWGEDPDNPGTLIVDGEQNLGGYTAGKYEVKVDLNTFTFIVEEIVAPENLFMVGSHNGWNNADTTQQFTSDGNGVFTRVQMFEANAEFKLLPTSGSWDGDWGEDPANPGTIIQDGEQNIKVVNAGSYLVTVDFNSLTYKLTDVSTLFMVGSHNGWNNADATQEFNTSGNGVFTRIQTFDAGAEFKMIPTSGSWDGDWGEDGANSGRIIQEDESNIIVENAGTYTVTVDFNTLSFNLKEVPDNLYLVGSPNGWDNGTAPAFTKLSEGVFEISQVLTASDEFKFLPQLGAWDNDWGESNVYPGMIVRDDESNVKSPGDATFTITVDFNKGTVTVE